MYAGIISGSFYDETKVTNCEINQVIYNNSYLYSLFGSHEIFDMAYYENDELDLRKDIAQNKLIVEENGNTTKAKDKFRMSEFAYQKNTDFYSLLSNIVLESDELKPSINTKKLSLSLLKNIIISSYNQLNNNPIENTSITIKIDSWTDTTTDGKNEKELISSLENHIDRETEFSINSIKLFDTKMLFTLLFGLLFSITLFILNQSFLGIIVILITLGILLYSFVINYKLKNEKIKQREQRKKESKTLLLNIIAEIVDFRFVYKDGNEIKNKIINILKSLDYKNYIKSNDIRNINIEKQEGFKNNKNNLFDEEKSSNKINPPSWDLIPPYDNVGMVKRI
jgi:hypothetical protein